MVKLKVMYEVVREATIEVPEEVANELDFQAMWEALHNVDPGCENLEGDILVVEDVMTSDILYE
jgi:hypothetical protein